MANINAKSVVAGGLVAGLIINVSETILNLHVLGEQNDAALSARNLPPVGGGAIAAFIAGGFGVGLLLMWLYAAMRPRFGAGPKTAVLTALAVWLLAFAWPSLTTSLMGFLPAKLLTVTAIWGLGEIVIAALAGGWLYKEHP